MTQKLRKTFKITWRWKAIRLHSWMEIFTHNPGSIPVCVPVGYISFPPPFFYNPISSHQCPAHEDTKKYINLETKQATHIYINEDQNQN